MFLRVARATAFRINSGPILAMLPTAKSRSRRLLSRDVAVRHLASIEIGNNAIPKYQKTKMNCTAGATILRKGSVATRFSSAPSAATVTRRVGMPTNTVNGRASQYHTRHIGAENVSRWRYAEPKSRSTGPHKVSHGFMKQEKPNSSSKRNQARGSCGRARATQNPSAKQKY